MCKKTGQLCNQAATIPNFRGMVKAVDGCTDHAAAPTLKQLDEFVGQRRLSSCIGLLGRPSQLSQRSACTTI